MIKFQKQEIGQTLWEVVIALAIAGIIAVGLVKVTGSSVKTTRYSTDQSQMTALAQQKISQIINSKNQDPNSFFNNPASFNQINIPEGEDYCLKTEVKDSSSILPTDTPNYLSAKMVTISVDVFWNRKTNDLSGCNNSIFSHTLHFETNVTN